VKGAVEDPEKPDITPTRHNLNAWPEDETAKPFKPTVDDEACSKLWKVYIDQAKEYDENVLREWKQDMETLLIFCESFVDLRFDMYLTSFSLLCTLPV